MAKTPESYAWLSDSPIGVAGCVTVVAQSDLARAGEAFGADPAQLVGGVPRTDAHWPEEYVGEWAWFTGPASSGSAEADVVVIEDNGFQGSRTEVLRVASRASASGKAASIFWNVNGVVIFSCAQKGTVVAAVELLGLDDDELASLPRSVRSLARLCEDESVDLVAVGASMVEAFTGVEFGEGVLRNGLMADLVPPPADLRGWERGHPVPSFMGDHLELLDGILVLAPDQQRALAEWAATAAVAEAGLEGEDAVMAVVAQFGRDDPPVAGSSLDMLRARLSKRSDEIWQREMENDTHGGIEGTFVHQQLWATSAVRQATHPDPLAAAVTAAGDLLGASACSRTERTETYVTDETGRYAVDDPDPYRGRVEAMARVLRELIASEPGTWPEHRRFLPRPLSPAERKEALRRDAERLSNGEFATYQTLEVDDEGW